MNAIILQNSILLYMYVYLRIKHRKPCFVLLPMATLSTHYSDTSQVGEEMNPKKKPRLFCQVEVKDI